MVGDGGVVDEHIDGPEPRDDLLDHALNVRFARNVGSDSHRGVAVGLVDAGGHSLGGVQAHVGDGDLRALPREGAGDLLADVPPSAGYDGDLVL